MFDSEKNSIKNIIVEAFENNQLKTSTKKVSEGDVLLVEKNAEKYLVDLSVKPKKIFLESEIGFNPVEFAIKELNSKYKQVREAMKVVGITGTNGKTTTAYLCHQV
jgi:UDP-N-acetylmuramyl pentapeptide synthase